MPRPSYKTGYARNAAESANPELWDGLVGAWVPMLGNVGKTGRFRNLAAKSIKDSDGNIQGASWTVGKYGPNLVFGGNPDRILFAARPIWQLKRNVMLTAVIRRPADSGQSADENNLFDAWEGGAASSYLLRYDSETKRFEFFLGYSGGSESVSFTPPVDVGLGNWHVVSAVCDGNYLYGMQDGVVCPEKTPFNSLISEGSSQNNLSLCGQLAGPRDFWIGDVAAWYIHNVTPVESQIKLLHADPLAPFRKRTKSVFVPTAGPIEPGEGSGAIVGVGAIVGNGEAPVAPIPEGSGSIIGIGQITGQGLAPVIGAAQGSGSIIGIGSLAGQGLAPAVGVAQGSGQITAIGEIIGQGLAPSVGMAQGSGVIDSVGVVTGLGYSPVIGANVGFGTIGAVGYLEGVGQIIAQGSGSISAVGVLVGVGVDPTGVREYQEFLKVADVVRNLKVKDVTFSLKVK